MKRRVNLLLCYILTILTVLSGIKGLNHSVTAMAEYRQQQDKTCIIIDPGHGGEDGGAVSVSGRAESAYNLEISNRLKDMLQLLFQEENEK